MLRLVMRVDHGNIEAVRHTEAHLIDNPLTITTLRTSGPIPDACSHRYLATLFLSKQPFPLVS